MDQSTNATVRRLRWQPNNTGGTFAQTDHHTVLVQPVDGSGTYEVRLDGVRCGTVGAADLPTAQAAAFATAEAHLRAQIDELRQAAGGEGGAA